MKPSQVSDLHIWIDSITISMMENKRIGRQENELYFGHVKFKGH